MRVYAKIGATEFARIGATEYDDVDDSYIFDRNTKKPTEMTDGRLERLFKGGRVPCAVKRSTS